MHQVALLELLVVRLDAAGLARVGADVLVKYNRRGGTVTLWCVDRPQNRLRLAVTDTGAGILAEKIARRFTPFERLDEEIVLTFPGYGYRRVTKALQRAGCTVNHKRVLRIHARRGLALPTQAPLGAHDGLAPSADDVPEPAAADGGDALLGQKNSGPVDNLILDQWVIEGLTPDG